MSSSSRRPTSRDDVTPDDALFSGNRRRAIPKSKSRAQATEAQSNLARGRHIRGYDERVNRNLTTNFGDFPVPIRDRFIPEGEVEPLRQAVARFMYPTGKPNEEPKVMSPAVIAQYRLRFATGDIAENVLRELPEDSQMRVDPELLAACQQAEATQMNQRSRGHLGSLMTTIRSVNKREAKLIFRTIMSLRPQAHGDIAGFVLQVMKMAYRLELHKRFPSFTLCLQKVWTDCLVYHFNKRSATDESLHAFWRKHGGYLEMWNVELKEMIDVLLNAQSKTKKFGEHYDTLNKVVMNVLGKAMFGWAVTRATKEVVENTASKHLVLMPKDKVLDNADIAKVVKDIIDELQDMGVNTVLGKKNREVEFQYIKWQIKMWVASMEEEVRLRVFAWIKSQTVGRVVPQMEWEAKFFVLGPLPDSEWNFADEVLGGFREARKGVDRSLSSGALPEDLDNLKALKKYVLKFKSIWAAEDAYFSLELALFDHIEGEAGLHTVQDDLLNCLPTPDNHLDLSESFALIEALQKSRWYPFVPDEAKSDVATTLDIMHAMKRGQKPLGTEVLYSSPFLRKIKDRISNFVYKSTPDGFIYGHEALTEYLLFHEAKSASGEGVSFSDIHLLSIYEWLLPNDLQLRCEALREQVAASMSICPREPSPDGDDPNATPTFEPMDVSSEHVPLPGGIPIGGPIEECSDAEEEIDEDLPDAMHGVKCLPAPPKKPKVEKKGSLSLGLEMDATPISGSLLPKASSWDCALAPRDLVSQALDREKAAMAFAGVQERALVPANRRRKKIEKDIVHEPQEPLIPKMAAKKAKAAPKQKKVVAANAILDEGEKDSDKKGNQVKKLPGKNIKQKIVKPSASIADLLQIGMEPVGTASSSSGS